MCTFSGQWITLFTSNPSKCTHKQGCIPVGCVPLDGWTGVGVHDSWPEGRGACLLVGGPGRGSASRLGRPPPQSVDRQTWVKTLPYRNLVLLPSTEITKNGRLVANPRGGGDRTSVASAFSLLLLFLYKRIVMVQTFNAYESDITHINDFV